MIQCQFLFGVTFFVDNINIHSLTIILRSFIRLPYITLHFNQLNSLFVGYLRHRLFSIELSLEITKHWITVSLYYGTAQKFTIMTPSMFEPRTCSYHYGRQTIRIIGVDCRWTLSTFIDLQYGMAIIQS